MSKSLYDGTTFSRNRLAYLVLGLSLVVILILGIVAIMSSEEKGTAMMVFNATLPVFASWVGTVLAFYFGKESFESANAQVEKMVKEISPNQKAQNYVDSIMLTPYAMTLYKMPSDRADDIMLSELTDTLKKYGVSRLPMINEAGEICYMIHESKINKYLADNGKEASGVTLQSFLDDSANADQPQLFTHNESFIIVSADTLVLQAKNRLEECHKCKDIIVTQSGTIDEPMIGWIPDVHLLEYLEV